MRAGQVGEALVAARRARVFHDARSACERGERRRERAWPEHVAAAVAALDAEPLPTNLFDMPDYPQVTSNPLGAGSVGARPPQMGMIIAPGIGCEWEEVIALVDEVRRAGHDADPCAYVAAIGATAKRGLWESALELFEVDQGSQCGASVTIA